MVCEKKTRSLLFSGCRKKSQPSGPPLSGKLGKPRSRWNGVSSVWDFPVPH